MTAKKTEVKETTKRNESMKVPKETLKEITKVPKATTQVPPKKETPKETINATKEVKEVKKTEVKELKEIEKVAPLKATPKKSEEISKNDVKSNATQEIKKTRNESMKVPKETTKVTKEKTFEKRPSAGKQIRTLFETIIPKLKDEHLEMLTSAEKTKEVLKIRYAFLKLSTENKEDRKINGNARYGSKTITINDKSYWITNDLYERNIEVFKAWIETIK